MNNMLKIIYPSNHKDYKSDDFKNIVLFLDSPRYSSVYKKASTPFLSGWVVSKIKNQEIFIIVKQHNQELKFSLNKDRKDVKRRLQQNMNLDVPLRSGFSYKLDSIDSFSIFLEIDGKKLPWKYISSKETEIDVLALFQSILIGSKKNTLDKLEQISTVDGAFKTEIMDILLNRTKTYSIQELDKLAQLSQAEKLYFNMFIKELSSPKILYDMMKSMEFHKTIKLNNPFNDGESLLTFNFMYENTNYLRFSSEDSSFYLIQYFYTVDAIYFPKYNFVLKMPHSHLNVNYLQKMFYYIFFKLDLLKSNFFDYSTINYLGIVVNDMTPYHFYYDFLPIIEYTLQFDMLNQFKNIFYLGGKSYFPVNDLYEIQIEEKMINSTDIDILLQEKNTFVLVAGSFYKNIPIDFIDKLDKRLVSRSLQIGKNKFSDYDKIINSSDFIIFVGVSSFKRMWSNQETVLVKVLNLLSTRYKNLLVVFDGMTKSLFQKSFQNISARSDNEIIKRISLSLNSKISTINLVDKESLEKIYVTSFVDFFIANYSTGSLYPSRILKKYGITHLGNNMLKSVKDIHIHHHIFMIGEKNIIDIKNTENNRIDFIDYQINEEIFVENVFYFIDIIEKKDKFIEKNYKNVFKK